MKSETELSNSPQIIARQLRWLEQLIRILSVSSSLLWYSQHVHAQEIEADPYHSIWTGNALGQQSNRIRPTFFYEQEKEKRKFGVKRQEESFVTVFRAFCDSSWISSMMTNLLISVPVLV